MSQFPQYIVNGSVNTDGSQYHVPPFDMNNVIKNFIENNAGSPAINHNVTNPDNVYFPQNKLPGQYIIQMPPSNYPAIQQQYVPMMQYSNGSFVYLNQQAPFGGAEPLGGGQYANMQQMQAQQMHQMQLSSRLLQIGGHNGHGNPSGNEINGKDSNDGIPTGSRSRKKTYKSHSKNGDSGHNMTELIGDLPRDTKNRPLSFICRECNKGFATQARLDQHFLCHTGDRPFVCPECRFAFTQKSYLVRHAAVHKDDRSFSCELCNKSYKHYGSLANHRKTHKNDSRKSEIVADTNPIKETVQGNCKPEAEMMDVNNNNNNLSGGYLIQNQPEFQQQQIDPNQSYSGQFNTDIPATHYPTQFQNLLTANDSTDFNQSFVHQLAYDNDNFFSLISNIKNESAAGSADQTQIDQSDPTAVSIESISNHNHIQSIAVAEEPIPTYTV